MKILNVIAFIVLAIGGINWLSVGIFDFNIVSAIFMGYRSVGSIIVYILVGLSAIYLALSAIISSGVIRFRSKNV